MNAKLPSVVLRSMLPIALGIGLAGRQASAQAQPPHSATILMSATVVTDHMAMSSGRLLSFGAVSRGAANTVQPTDAGAGQWWVGGNAAGWIGMTFELPAALSNRGRPEADPLPISFGSTAGRWRADTDAPDQGHVFDPSVGATGRFAAGPTPGLSVAIGGTVHAPASVAPGVYRGTITLTLAYF